MIPVQVGPGHFMVHGRIVIVDEVDEHHLAGGKKWHINNGGYCAHAYWTPADRRKVKIELLHRTIMQAPAGMEVDHINMDKRDNRRSNLRLATRTQNIYNRAKYGKNPYKGVQQCPRTKKWRATITADKVIHRLGFFDTPELAYAAYCAAALKLHGEFARLA